MCVCVCVCMCVCACVCVCMCVYIYICRYIYAFLYPLFSTLCCFLVHEGSVPGLWASLDASNRFSEASSCVATSTPTR